MVGTGREGGENREEIWWELGGKEVGTGVNMVGTGKEGGGNREGRRWELGGREVGTGRKYGGNWERRR